MTTRRTLQIAICLAALGVSRGVFAQQVGDVSIGYANLAAKTPLGTGTGLQLSDGLILHAGVGFEAGYDTNVFFADKGKGVIGSPIALVVPYLGLTNATRTGVAPSRVFFELEGTAGFRRYLSNADQLDMNLNPTGRKVSDQPGFLPTANGTLVFSSGQALSMAILDSFVRAEDPPYIGSPGPLDASVIHYVNNGSVDLRWSPGGGRLQGILRYTNTLNVFNADSGYDFANSVSHQGSLDLSWKWLPKTAIFVQATQGYIDYYNPPAGGAKLGTPTAKFNSYPLHLLAGLRGLVTQKTSVNLSAGYANAFYVEGPNPQGLAGHLSANAELIVTPTLLNSMSVGYHHDFQNSIIGNYYNVDAVTAWLQQQVAGRLLLAVNARYEYRNYHLVFPDNMGVLSEATRVDNFIQVGGTVDYHPKSWAYVGVGYTLLLNDAGTPTSVNAPVGATYTKQQIFGRIGVVY